MPAGSRGHHSTESAADPLNEKISLEHALTPASPPLFLVDPATLHNEQIGRHVRSKQVHTAIAQRNNRFEICQMVSKGVRKLHKDGTRMADSITDVLGMLSAEPATLGHISTSVMNPKA